MARGNSALFAMLPASFQYYPHGEARQGQHTSPAPRLTIEPVEPFQAKALHLTRRSPLATRNKVVSTTHTDSQSRRQTREVARNPDVLSRCPIGHAEHISLSCAYTLDNLFFFRKSRRACVSPGNLQARRQTLQASRSLFSYPWSSAK